MPASKKAAAKTKKPALESVAKKSPLPTWDLTDFYPSHTHASVKADIEKVAKDAVSFQKSYQGKVSKLSGDELGKAISKYENLHELIGKLGSYASLLNATDMLNGDYTRFYQNTLEALNEHTTHLIFFSLEINALDEKKLKQAIKESKKLAHYAPWLRDVRIMKPYQLSEIEEKLLHEKSITGAQAWSRLFDETLTRLTFEMDGKKMQLEQVLHLLSGKDAATRKKAAHSLGKTFNANLPIFTTITNVLAKDKAIEDRLRGFKAPISSRNLANLVEDDVVDALLKAVKKSYPKLSHRYYKMKAGWFKQKQLNYWDRNAPIPEDADQPFTWERARDTVLDAYGRFSPKLRELGQEFFDKPWIDVPTRPGKATGAFAHPTVPSVHPYLLLNFQGKLRDVMTLAHELGHGVHQVLSAKQGALMADTPLTLAETASVFGEQLTFRALLDQQKDKKKRKAMLASKVEDMLNTVVRQVAFCEFERRIHAERAKGEIPQEKICDIWMDVQKESLGPALKFDDHYRGYWAYISHFIHSPFYVYAYAFGDCLVNALYAAYLEKPKGFPEKYFAMLEAGGTLHHKELLAPFGLDATAPAFWQKGLNVISGFIDELETL
ncbi:M3 family oligoendopeptidase [bacterium]|nr:M3 family oligoendopeptidase [bacterium]